MIIGISGTKAFNVGTGGIDHWGILSDSDVNSLLDISDASMYNIAVVFSNGDYDANDVMMNSYHSGNTWYVKFDRIVRGDIRVNYIIMYRP